MRNFIKRLIRVLDGKPQAYGHSERGQSVLELALVTPLLIIMLVGLVEIGWFARNYLTLQEVTRVGARRGATLQQDNSPIRWDERASYYFNSAYDPYFSDYPDGAASDEGSKSWHTSYRRNVRNCGAIQDSSIQPNQVGFFNLIACQMINSLDPLELRWEGSAAGPNDIDDIIISAFSVQIINNDTAADGGDLDLANTSKVNGSEFSETGYIPVIVGRYPTRTNECNVWEDGGGNRYAYTVERDPFDYYRQQQPAQNNAKAGSAPSDFDAYRCQADTDTVNVNGTTYHYPLEMAVENNNCTSGQASVGFDPYPTDGDYEGSPADSLEMQRGWTLTGQHEFDETREINGSTMERVCWGSERSIYWVQQRLQTSDFITADDQRQYFANQGVVLVEIYWQHELLLGALPVFSPIYNALDDEQTTIYTWSAFPAPAVTPNLRYNLTSSDFGGN